MNMQFNLNMQPALPVPVRLPKNIDWNALWDLDFLETGSAAILKTCVPTGVINSVTNVFMVKIRRFMFDVTKWIFTDINIIGMLTEFFSFITL